jgi:SAM-dependent methyltransferase
MSSWYESWFADPRYLALYKHRDDTEADQMVSLIERTIGIDTSRSILDIPCGTGRHLTAFANRGYRHLGGRDLSQQFIEIAMNDAREHNFTIGYSIADMRDPIQNTYDIVLNLFTSFGYFDDAENMNALRNITSAVTRGGYFIMDFLNAANINAGLKMSERFTLDGYGEVAIRKEVINGVVNKHIHFASDGKEFIESVRLYTKDELLSLIGQCSLSIFNIYGDYHGAAYSSESPRVIIFARNDQ